MDRIVVVGISRFRSSWLFRQNACGLRRLSGTDAKILKMLRHERQGLKFNSG